MNQKDSDRLCSLLRSSPLELIISKPEKQETLIKIKIRQILLKGSLCYQIEEFTKTQAFHKNIVPEELPEHTLSYLNGRFRQALIRTGQEEAHVLISKSGAVSILKKKQKQTTDNAAGIPSMLPLSHNRTKQYLLPEGTPVPFLIELGIMSKDGHVIKAKYDKFRQINRFLEFVQDILPSLPKDRTVTILDFGCGKSYLTFALYHFVKLLNHYDVRIVGLDLKKDVIANCSRLAETLGYTELTFLHGDIADYTGTEHADMVVTLHACDTATDYALYKAISWNASVILSVPCCQHELNRQLNNEALSPLLRYGLIKERTAALFTDAIRANLLEAAGYQTQLLEFIDIEHTPKNILIRAVRKSAPTKEEFLQRLASVEETLRFLHADLTLYRLLTKTPHS